MYILHSLIDILAILAISADKLSILKICELRTP